MSALLAFPRPSRRSAAVMLVTAFVLGVVMSLAGTPSSKFEKVSVVHAANTVTEWQQNSRLLHYVQCAGNAGSMSTLGYRGTNVWPYTVTPDEGWNITLSARYSNGTVNESHLAEVYYDGNIGYNLPPSGINQIEDYLLAGESVAGAKVDGPQQSTPSCTIPVIGGTELYYNDYQIRWGAPLSYSSGGSTYNRVWMKFTIAGYSLGGVKYLVTGTTCANASVCGGTRVNWGTIDLDSLAWSGVTQVVSTENWSHGQ